MNDGIMLYRANAIQPSEDRAELQERLQARSEAGDMEATKILADLQLENRYSELINNMDDDEFTLPAIEN